MLQPRILAVTPKLPSTLVLSYETGEVKEFNVAPYISGPWYEELKDPVYFCSVKVLPGGIGIEWSNGQDIAPHELYEQSVKAG